LIFYKLLEEQPFFFLNFLYFYTGFFSTWMAECYTKVRFIILYRYSVYMYAESRQRIMKRAVYTYLQEKEGKKVWFKVVFLLYQDGKHSSFTTKEHMFDVLTEFD